MISDESGAGRKGQPQSQLHLGEHTPRRGGRYRRNRQLQGLCRRRRFHLSSRQFPGIRRAHRIAMQQMKGGFSAELKVMRDDLLNLVSLMELELDFSEKDVEFADRSQLTQLLSAVSARVTQLIESFSLGNVIKNGVPVAIVGVSFGGGDWELI